MNFTPDSTCPDVILIDPRLFPDDRGHFFESYREDIFSQNGIHTPFVQDNQSVSSKHVLRGCHFQKPPKEQAKLVYCESSEHSYESILGR